MCLTVNLQPNVANHKKKNPEIALLPVLSSLFGFMGFACKKISGAFFVQHVAQHVGACTSAMLRGSLVSSFGHAHSLQLIVFFV